MKYELPYSKSMLDKMKSDNYPNLRDETVLIFALCLANNIGEAYIFLLLWGKFFLPTSRKFEVYTKLMLEICVDDGTQGIDWLYRANEILAQEGLPPIYKTKKRKNY